MDSPSLSAIIIGIPDGVSEEELYGEGELAPDDPGEPLDVTYEPDAVESEQLELEEDDSDVPESEQLEPEEGDTDALESEQLEPAESDIEELEAEKLASDESMQYAAELGIEAGGENADAFDSLSSTCEDCGETFRTEDCLGREHPHEDLCDHCYSKHFDE